MEKKFTPVHYNSPMQADMAVMLVFYNPQRSVRLVQNILTVVHYLKTAKIPYYIHEISINGDPHLFASAENIKLSHSTSYMFYKENLIQTLLPQIPIKFTKICIIDADIFFDDPDWYTLISAALDTYDVCQPRGTTYLLGPDYKSTIQMHDISNKVCAFRREWYEEVDLPDTTVAGGGDRILGMFLGDASEDKACSFYKEAMSLTSMVIARRGYCNLNIYHYYHGYPANRCYESCMDAITDLLVSNGLTLHDIIQRRRDGILEWAPAYRDPLNIIMHTYFDRRNDDLIKPEFISTNKLFTPPMYSYPTHQDMVVVIPFFNPVQYNRSAQNILMVVHWMEQARIPYYIAELAYKNNPFLFKSAPNILQFRSESNLFYKENLVDVIEAHLPATYTKICMLDADIFFSCPDWYALTSQLLDTHDICQPFTNAIWTHADFTEFRRRTHCLGSSLPIIDWLREHPGFVWAFHRDWYRRFPYRHIPICTTGGDTILHDLVKGRRMSLYKYYSKYYHEIESQRIPVTYTWLDGDIHHMNHGSYNKRLYPNYVEDLHKELSRFGFSAAHEAVYRRADGILEWKPECREVINAFNDAYFISREEDDF